MVEHLYASGELPPPEGSNQYFPPTPPKKPPETNPTFMRMGKYYTSAQEMSNAQYQELMDEHRLEQKKNADLTFKLESALDLVAKQREADHLIRDIERADWDPMDEKEAKSRVFFSSLCTVVFKDLSLLEGYLKHGEAHGLETQINLIRIKRKQLEEYLFLLTHPENFNMYDRTQELRRIEQKTY